MPDKPTRLANTAKASSYHIGREPRRNNLNSTPLNKKLKKIGVPKTLLRILPGMIFLREVIEITLAFELS
jgi:hypothetical protein